MNKKILLVEDDSNLGFVIKDNLELKGFDVTLCNNGQEGEDLFKSNGYDLCILDVMMPRKDGFTLAKSIREKNKNIPILFVTAKSMIEDKIAGFQSGGDDYIVKPFSMDELLLRIDVFLRRSSSDSASIQSYKIGNYLFDYNNYTLDHNGNMKVLTQKEAEVLKMLCESKTRVLKREEILKAVWGNNDYFLGRSMDVFISKLRKYLKDDPSVQIVNYHGVGFRLEETN
jgi:DNA-binding response OmpR family regulator